MKIRKAVFPVAGMGTRLLPATKSQPKEMLPVGYKPVVQYVVEEMIAQGLDRFLFITGRKKRSIEDHFDDDPELEARLADKSFGEVDYASAGIEFYYARQRRPTGNGDAVRMAREFIGDDSFVVGFGDTIIHSPRTPGVVGRMMQSHIESGAAATIGVWEVPREETCKYGVVTPQGEAGSDFAIAEDAPMIAELQQLQVDITSTLKLPAPRDPVVVYLFSAESAYRRYMRKTWPSLPAPAARRFDKGRRPTPC